MVRVFASWPSALGSIPSIPKKSEENIINVAKVNQRHLLEESGLWLENVDWTHLVPASGMLDLQKVKAFFVLFHIFVKEVEIIEAIINQGLSDSLSWYCRLATVLLIFCRIALNLSGYLSQGKYTFQRTDQFFSSNQDGCRSLLTESKARSVCWAQRFGHGPNYTQTTTQAIRFNYSAILKCSLKWLT